MANENNTKTALQEPDSDIERRLEIESLFGEVEAARSEISALNWCIQRMEYALRSRNVRGEIRQLVVEARDWVDDSYKTIAELEKHITTIREEI